MKVRFSLKCVIEVTSEYIESLKKHGEIMIDIKEVVETYFPKEFCRAAYQIWRVVQKKIIPIGFYF